jgi:pimeloyl-ACP methyl ester carboxylesterase
MEVKLKYALWRGLEKVPLPRDVRDKAVKSRQLLGLMARWPRLDKEKLSCIQAPVLILTGRGDMIRPRHSLWMGEQIPDSKVVFVKGADHFTLLKKEKAYGAHIMAWLRERGL